MEPFTTLTATMAPLPYDDVDTDQIIPAKYLKGTTRDGLDEGLFARWRYQPDGSPDPEFPLNRPEYDSAQVLVTGANFGCGSSREHAPWSLHAYGFRAIVGPSFADIFRNNALKNGLLPVAVEPEVQQALLDVIENDPSAEIKIDLRAQTVTLPDGRQATFAIDSFSKQCLLEGVDQLGYLLRQEEEIAAYEERMGKD
jgi:3-isopropylmalate/(R)-2-methylmalate dehydratase small subunit